MKVRIDAIAKLLAGILGALIVAFYTPIVMFCISYWLKEGLIPNHWSWHNRGAYLADYLAESWFGFICAVVFTVIYWRVVVRPIDRVSRTP